MVFTISYKVNMATKTVTLNGTEQRVEGLGGLNALIVNNTTEMLYASAKAGIVPYADGVIEIKAGASRGLLDANGTVYLLGNGGRAELTGTSCEVNFSVPSASDEADGELMEYVDTRDAETLNAAKEYGNELFAGVTSFSVRIVDRLPASDIDGHTIYFVPKSGGDGDNYDEYMYIGGGWEHIGTTSVDLSGHYTSAQTDALLNGKANKTDIPASLPANGGNSATVNGHTVDSDVPANAKFTDTVYTHPAASGNKHIPSGGSSGQILRWSADGTAVWGDDNNTTYSAATATAAGLVSTAAQTFGGSKTFNGSVICNGAGTVGTAQARNIYAGTADLTAGTSALATGAIYIMYE